ncbi:hypothetical protein CCP3SC5AM1_1340007 [Gammaproteobacteria bacterium]
MHASVGFRGETRTAVVYLIENETKVYVVSGRTKSTQPASDRVRLVRYPYPNAGASRVILVILRR